MSDLSTNINYWPQFGDIHNIKRLELSDSCRRFIRREEKELNRNCRRIWLFKNRLNEVFLFGKFCHKRDSLIVTLAAYNPRVGFVTSR